ncbi:DUF6364 family protein [Pedobacter sp. CFBP9032]|uniref:DUF6364 family protein n=1 Tax=Pedobacter sp. CFBP9032 TaxID=3096539 RepID=UPI002A6A8A5D|nr:DUF6364 family protein [Pedobacter sp. CFBP9032]MDY0903506.1 DUF6364 family protein [Pedobacter sp. CFBP9032]
MDTKLTLKLNQEIIERAKLYASDKKLSLSRLIENYLNALTADQNKVQYFTAMRANCNIINSRKGKDFKH